MSYERIGKEMDLMFGSLNTAQAVWNLYDFGLFPHLYKIPANSDLFIDRQSKQQRDAHEVNEHM